MSPSSNPAIAIFIETTPSHDAVDVRMEFQVAGPSMKHRGDAQLSTESLRVCAKREQGIGRRLEEQREEARSVSPRQRLELLGDGEDDMKMAGRQNALLALGNPLGLS